MATLLELKQTFKSLYVKYEFYITLAWKFILTLISLNLINGKLGYQSALTSPMIVLMCSLLCAILPPTFIVVVSALFVLVHLWALSTETALVALVLFLVMFLLYYRFTPKDAVAVILTPICFCLHIPYVMPIGLGLVGTPASAISVMFGTVTYYYLEYIATNTNSFKDSGTSDEAADTVTRFQSILEGVFQNHTMISVMIVFAFTVVLVYVIRRLSVDHSWDIAIVTGSVVMMISLLVTSVIFEAEISMIGILIGCVVSGLLMKCLEFFSFNLDYSRVENVQFEDDEYYYYVKAVPKVAVPAADRRVKQINRAQPRTDSADDDNVVRSSRSQLNQEAFQRSEGTSNSQPRTPQGSSARQSSYQGNGGRPNSSQSNSGRPSSSQGNSARPTSSQGTRQTSNGTRQPNQNNNSNNNNNTHRPVNRNR